MSLRYYQIEAIDAIWNYITDKRNASPNPLIALPTGTGKSHVIAGFTQRVMQQYPQARFLMSTHVKELIQQNASKLLEAWPQAPLGINSAGLGQRDTRSPILFGGVKSLLPHIEAIGYRDFLIVDEAHLINPDNDTQYQKLINGLRERNPYIRTIGLTATWYRNQLGSLVNGGLFTDIVYNMCDKEGFLKLVAQGYICPPVAKSTETKLDVSGVKKEKGEFNSAQLQAAVDQDDITTAALKEVMQYGQDRRAWLIFASGIEHAEHITAKLNAWGVPGTAVHSKMGDNARDAALRDFKAGKLRFLANNNVLTTGFDYPAIDLIPMLRPTMSTGLWVQMIGRGTRPYAGKNNCLVLDFAGNTRRLGPINDPVLPKQKGEGPPGEAPVKVCPSCGVFNHAAVRVCGYCGAEFPIEEKISHTAFTHAMLTETPQIESYPVHTVFYSKHAAKTTGINTLKVSYACGLQQFNEYIMFEHDGLPKHRAHDWWRQRHKLEPPDTIEQALSVTRELRIPRAISVHVNAKWPEIVRYDF